MTDSVQSGPVRWGLNGLCASKVGDWVVPSQLQLLKEVGVTLATDFSFRKSIREGRKSWGGDGSEWGRAGAFRIETGVGGEGKTEGDRGRKRSKGMGAARLAHRPWGEQ